MTITELQIIFEQNKDEENAAKQEKYLKNQFKFLGLAKPKRAALEKEFVKSSKQLEKSQLIEVIFSLSALTEREYLYTSQMVLQANYLKFNYEDILVLTKITRNNQWWENTDGFQSFLKKWFRANPEYIKPFVLEFYQDQNMWMRRLAIIAQLGMKDITDFSVMKKAIIYNLKFDQFFIQKAIGWALRDYSKVSPNDVAKFIDLNRDQMSNLAIREASKYLD